MYSICHFEPLCLYWTLVKATDMKIHPARALFQEMQHSIILPIAKPENPWIYDSGAARTVVVSE